MTIETAKGKRPLLQEFTAKCAQLNIPIHAALELTYRCNLHCAHCYIDYAEANELSFEEWQDILGQLQSSGTAYLLLTGGEILVRPDSLDIAAYARRRGFFVSLLTNCTLVTPAIAKTIAELRPFEMGTSLYGATATTHESVTKVPGSFKKTLEGIRLLVKAGVSPLVQTMLMKVNVEEIGQIRALVESLGARSRISTGGMAPSKSGDDFPFHCEPEAEQLLKCSWRPETTEHIDGQEASGLCKAGKGTCSISPNGNVFPCLMFPMKLGNLRESTFDSIWRLEPCAELRYLRSMRRTDLHACQTCKIKDYCQRCTGIAYLETGRIDGPSPSACRQASMRMRLSQNTEGGC